MQSIILVNINNNMKSNSACDPKRVQAILFFIISGTALYFYDQINHFILGKKLFKYDTN